MPSWLELAIVVPLEGTVDVEDTAVRTVLENRLVAHTVVGAREEVLTQAPSVTVCRAASILDARSILPNPNGHASSRRFVRRVHLRGHPPQGDAKVTRQDEGAPLTANASEAWATRTSLHYRTNTNQAIRQNKGPMATESGVSQKVSEAMY